MDKYEELINTFSDILKNSKDYHIAYIYQIGYASLIGSSIGSDYQKSAVIDEVFASPEQMAESLLRNWRWQWFYDNRESLQGKDYDDICDLDYDIPIFLKEPYTQELQDFQKKIQIILQKKD